jgi:hypothetical protein
MRKPRGTCYPQAPSAGRGCYPGPRDRDGCYSYSGDPVGSVGGSGSVGGALLRDLLRVVAAPRSSLTARDRQS